jgi:hypothetical protein
VCTQVLGPRLRCERWRPVGISRILLGHRRGFWPSRGRPRLRTSGGHSKLGSMASTPTGSFFSTITDGPSIVWWSLCHSRRWKRRSPSSVCHSTGFWPSRLTISRFIHLYFTILHILTHTTQHVLICGSPTEPKCSIIHTTLSVPHSITLLLTVHRVWELGSRLKLINKKRMKIWIRHIFGSGDWDSLITIHLDRSWSFHVRIRRPAYLG